MTTRKDPVRTPSGAVLLGSPPAPAAGPAGRDLEDLERHVEGSLEALGADPRDAGTAALAVRLAADLDALPAGDRTIPQLARVLAGVLEQLELTPAARRDPDDDDQAADTSREVSPLERVRARSAERLAAVEG